MFSNAFDHERELQILGLLEGAPSEAVTTRASARRRIEGLQTRVYALESIQNSGCDNGHAFQRRVLEQYASQNGRLARCDGLFYRMARYGQPRLATTLRRPYSFKHWWVAVGPVNLDPRAFDRLKRPLWRLLDPTSISWVDLVALECVIAQQVRFVPEPISMDLSELALPYRSNGLSAIGETGVVCPLVWLERALLKLRRAEASGDLFAYYLNLLETLDGCSSRFAHSPLEPLGTEFARLLTCCFSKVHVALSDGSGLQMEDLWLQMKELAVALGYLRVPEHVAPKKQDPGSRMGDAFSALVRQVTTGIVAPPQKRAKRGAVRSQRGTRPDHVRIRRHFVAGQPQSDDPSTAGKQQTGSGRSLQG